MSLKLAELVQFLRRHRLAVQASLSPSGPQAAVVGFAVSDAGELFFDTLRSSRKCQNLRKDPRIALVVGWDDERTLQYEGIADEPEGNDLARLKHVYFATFPDGRSRESWPEIVYFRVRLRWARLSDFSGSKPSLSELSLVIAG